MRGSVTLAVKLRGARGPPEMVTLISAASSHSVRAGSTRLARRSEKQTQLRLWAQGTRRKVCTPLPPASVPLKPNTTIPY